ncbi:MAG: hypothetical protein JO170_04260 [Verrucomicrobia bacterium]|nr:hypothetical protein [Verrucomicrobiota bacterium]
MSNENAGIAEIAVNAGIGGENPWSAAFRRPGDEPDSAGTLEGNRFNHASSPRYTSSSGELGPKTVKAGGSR